VVVEEERLVEDRPVLLDRTGSVVAAVIELLFALLPLLCE